MLQKESVDKTTLELIRDLQNKEYLKDFVLVGGTALALKIGHRRSVDIDLFINTDFDEQKVLENLESDFNFELDRREKNTLKGIIGNVKVDILAHKYKLINKPEIGEEIMIASTDDLIAMKLNAIATDGTRVKDFIDLHYLLDNYTIKDMLSCYELKYDQRNSMHVLKSINYFDDVSVEDWPVILKDKELTWDSIKNKINKSVSAYTSTLL